MVQINFGQREVSCKLVYYGPGMSGKTTNLEIIHQKAPDTAKGEMVSIATETDRTLYFDYLPLDLGQVANMHTKFQLYTVPGQIYYNATRKLVLQGVDGVIFVADSSKSKIAENLESLQNLRDNLHGMGINLDEIPFVLQYNKRDLPDAMSVALLDEHLNPMRVPTVEACARDGKGVFQALKVISKIVIEKLNTEQGQRRRTAQDLTPSRSNAAAVPPAAAPAPQAAAPQQAAPVQPQQAAPAAAPAAQAPVPQAAAAPAAPQQPPTKKQPAPKRQQAAGPTTTRSNRQALSENSAKQKHLSKKAPPKLKERANNIDDVDLGDTEPNLRRYKGRGEGGGPVRMLFTILLVLIILIIIVAGLFVFVQPVRDALLPLMPTQMQEAFLEKEDNNTTSTPPPAQTTPAPTPAAAGTATTLAPAAPTPVVEQAPSATSPAPEQATTPTAPAAPSTTEAQEATDAK